MDVVSYILALKGAKSYTDEAIKENSILVKGYYKDGAFYSDQACTIELEPSNKFIYLDLFGHNLWEYEDSQYVQVTESVTDAIVAGYYLNGEFYKDTTYTEKLEHSNLRYYIDISTFDVYKYNGDGVGYQKFVSLPLATPMVAGVMKLYDTLGDNEDGTINQKITTKAFGTKLTVDGYENEELILSFDTII